MTLIKYAQQDGEPPDKKRIHIIYAQSLYLY
jgi:hypothetical protein